MSVRVFRWAKEQSLPGLQKSVLVYLADRCNDACGYAWPSVARIAKDTGWSPRAVSNAIRDLSEHNLIAIRHQYHESDSSLGPNRYYFPEFGDPPVAGKAFPIRGGFDHNGEWDEEQ